MEFIIVRRSGKTDEDGKPCKGTYKKCFVTLEVRTYRTEEEFDTELAKWDGTW